MDNIKKNLSDLPLEELHSLYGMVSEICAEYVKMTDNYSLATGDKNFEKVPREIDDMIKNRQKFVSYKIKLQSALINKITDEMNKYE